MCTMIYIYIYVCKYYVYTYIYIYPYTYEVLHAQLLTLVQGAVLQQTESFLIEGACCNIYHVTMQIGRSTIPMRATMNPFTRSFAASHIYIGRTTLQGLMKFDESEGYKTFCAVLKQTHAHTHTHTDTHRHVQTHTHTRKHTDRHTHTRTQRHRHTHTHTHSQTQCVDASQVKFGTTSRV